MSALVPDKLPWGSGAAGSDDHYPFDDDQVPVGADDDVGINPLRIIQPSVRGADIFCARLPAAPLSEKEPLCLPHLVRNTSLFTDDDEQPISPT